MHTDFLRSSLASRPDSEVRALCLDELDEEPTRRELRVEPLHNQAAFVTELDRPFAPARTSVRTGPYAAGFGPFAFAQTASKTAQRGVR